MCVANFSVRPCHSPFTGRPRAALYEGDGLPVKKACPKGLPTKTYVTFP